MQDFEPEGVVDGTEQPEPVVDAAPEPVVEVAREPVIEIEPEPEPVVEPEPVLEISYPDVPVEEAPPGLSVDAFKDIKPVSFGGVAVEEDEPAQPDPEPAPPVVEPEPVIEPEPVAAVEPEPVAAVEPEPVAAVEPEPEPEPEIEPEIEPMPIVEPLSYPLDDEPVIVEEPQPSFAAVLAETDLAPEPEAEVSAEPEPEPEPKKRGFRIPNPQLKLPSFGGKKSLSTGMKLPQITLPPNLQGPLTDVERKIALGSVVAIVAAAAFGYSTAPSDEAVSPAPTTPPAAVER